ncbi:MAG: hydroxylamine reductase [Lentisphaerae bacterium]|jgi:hydroxylamine reductase|nr:hydroxylamine reductase [Lentisphaerota bacterium]
MNDMFCFQCEQTAGGKGCTRMGVCGKNPEAANLQDEITAGLVTLARALDGKPACPACEALFMDALFMTVTNVNFDPAALTAMRDRICAAIAIAGGAAAFTPENLFHGDPDVVSLRATLLFGLRGMAAYAAHARVLGKTDPTVSAWFQKGMKALGDDHSVGEWLSLIMEFGTINLACMELLDAANTGAYGNPVPTQVETGQYKGPFIVVTGHDLRDLKMLLEQTDGKGVNVYTHGEMLPAHAYPELKKHPQLKGNFGTAWQNQQKEFADLPGVVLYTTNCLMPPKPSYAGNLFTTAEVGWPGVTHVAADASGHKDFSAMIEHAIRLGGWQDETRGVPLMTGFAHNAVLSVADRVVEAVKDGTIKHIFLVGGCDGARLGRDYYTEFVEKAPQDTLILTLACGKYRFNHLQSQLGDISGIPRLLDMGQCNDAYSAIKVAVALAKVFDCGVNDLPLSLILSWYEQKAVCILLTLLALGIKNIRIGPTLPAFISPAVLNVLVEKFGLTPIKTADEDLASILKTA